MAVREKLKARNTKGKSKETRRKRAKIKNIRE